MSTEYYSAPLYDAIVAEMTEENPHPIMARCLCSSLNGILDAVAGEHVVVTDDGGVNPANFSDIFMALTDGILPRPKPANIVLQYAPDSPATSGAVLIDKETGSQIATAGTIEVGHHVQVDEAVGYMFEFTSVYYSVDDGELVEVVDAPDIGYRFTMPEGHVAVIVNGTASKISG